MAVRNWLLPENIEDILPPQAQRIERMRAKLLELFRVHGYQLVIPPMLEYLEPLQTGAEIYGHAGIESDLEIQTLLVEALAACGVSGARLDIGHVAVFRAICRHGGVGPELESELYEVLSAKDLPALRTVTRRLPGATRKALLALPELYGDGAMLER